MFNSAQAQQLYQYDLAVLRSAGQRENLLEQSWPPFIVGGTGSHRQFRLPLRDLLKPEVFEELARRFS